MAKREISRDDILAMEDYARQRRQRRQVMAGIKRHRRLAVGPDATFYFENYDTMFYQVHEMLHVERGGAAQIADELAAYNPLIPNGAELVATLMFEIDDEARRHRVLSALGGVEHTVTIGLEGETVAAVPEGDVERSTAEGKASSVHFLHFPFTPPRIAAFRKPGARVSLAIDHPGYGHMATLPEAVRAALAGDFD